MVLVETSRPKTTLMFNKLAVGFEIDFLLSALGRAYRKQYADPTFHIVC